MKKIFKALTIAVIALTAVFACVFVAGCTDKSEPKSDYNFTIVYEDGTAVNGQKDSVNGGKVYIQICAHVCIDLNMPNINIYASESGKLSLSQDKINELFGQEVTEFTFHVRNVKGCKSDCEIPVNGKGDYKITLEAA